MTRASARSRPNAANAASISAGVLAHPRRPVTIWASDRVSLSASRRALPCLHRGGYTTHTVRSSAARARTPQQTARTACNDLLDHLVGNGEQRRGYVEAVAVTDVDPTARPSAA